MRTNWRSEIAERAYRIWESEGRPDGKALDHWLRAEGELQEAVPEADPPPPQTPPQPQTRRAPAKAKSAGLRARRRTRGGTPPAKGGP